MPRSSLNNLHLHLSLGLPGFVAPEFLVEEVSRAVHEVAAIVVVGGAARVEVAVPGGGGGRGSA